MSSQVEPGGNEKHWEEALAGLAAGLFEIAVNMVASVRSPLIGKGLRQGRIWCTIDGTVEPIHG